MRVALVAVGLCGLVAAQSTARVEGRVVDQSGAGVRKATVRAQDAAPVRGEPVTEYLEITDGAGHFVFTNLPPGRYTLYAERIGFSRLRNTGSPPPTLALQAGEVKGDVEISLIQQGVISGQITDQDGDPVFGASVQALRVQYNGLRRYLTEFAEATSDDQGNFRILNVDPGRYYPMADNPRARANLGTVEHRGRSARDVDILTFYPSAAELRGSLAIDVRAGAEVRGVNIRMIKARVFSIRGKTVDSRTGAPVAANLDLTLKSGDIGRQNGRDEANSPSNTGAFEFHGLRQGTYILQSPPNDLNLAGRIEVTVGNSNVEGLVFALSPTVQITGTVRAEDGDVQTPGSNASFDRLPGNTLRVVLANADTALANESAGPVQADGSFKIENIAWSRFIVNLTPLAQGMYVKSVRFSGQDALKTPLDLTSGAGGVLEIVVSRRAAELNATVRGNNGDAVSGVAMTIWPKTPSAVDTLNTKIVHAGPAGTVRLTSIPPGEYYVAAWEDVDPSVSAYPDFLARFTEMATMVKVGESDKVSVDLTVIPKDKIAAAVAKMP